MFFAWWTWIKPNGLGSGSFHCPGCGTERWCTHVDATRVFFIFIVIIPMWFRHRLWQFIQCETCRKLLGVDVAPSPRSEETAQPDEELLEQVREELEMGTSVQETKKLLLDMGVDGEVVIKHVKTALGGREKKCARCNLTFAATVGKCAHCGLEL